MDNNAGDKSTPKKPKDNLSKVTKRKLRARDTDKTETKKSPEKVDLKEKTEVPDQIEQEKVAPKQAGSVLDNSA